ncbi:UDP-xylose transporter 3, partial [Cucurbita argyrosperma subsp. sororia]
MRWPMLLLGDSMAYLQESGTMTRHPLHRSGCTCIVCIQPPSGKGSINPHAQRTAYTYAPLSLHLSPPESRSWQDSTLSSLKMSDSQKFQLGTIGALSLSVVSSVSIVICNKALISTLGFTFATTLTSWHLLVTFCSLHVALLMKLFEHKPFDARAVMGFGILNGISIGLLNLSLGFNSVGFYQMTKLAIIPCTVLLETLFFRKKFSKSIQFSLTILLLGVGIATVTDLQLNALGSFLSLLAVLTTCVAQIMTNTIQKKFKVSSTQLLYQSCPYQALTLFVAGPFLDWCLTDLNVFAFKYTPQVLFFIVLSCLISVSVNFSTFLVIGKTSAVTYQVLGHLKTCLVLGFGYVLLHDPFSWRNILGILVAIVGMVLYSYYCSLESQQKCNEVSSAQLSQVKESESDPLLSVENGVAILGDGVGPKAPAAVGQVIPPSNEEIAGKTPSHADFCVSRVRHLLKYKIRECSLFIGELLVVEDEACRRIKRIATGREIHG